MARKTKTKSRKPLHISIHGHGIDIDATFSDSQLEQALASALNRMNVPGPTTAPIVDHDFDVVQRIIQHASDDVLRAVLVLIQDRLATREAAG